MDFSSAAFLGGGFGNNSTGLPSPYLLPDNGWWQAWNRPDTPLAGLWAHGDPHASLGAAWDTSNGTRLSVVTVEDDQLRSLAAELRQKGETVLVLDPTRDGLGDLARTLQQQGRQYDEVLVFGHGADDNFRIGCNTLSNRTLWRHRAALEAIGEALRPGGDLLLYGCDLASGSRGQQLIERLAKLTGADVAASTDLTYANALGRDWDLEWATGPIADGGARDVLTGLRWQGQLGGTASLSDSGTELNITEASGSIGIRRDAATGAILISGTTTTTLDPGTKSITKVLVSGQSFEVSGINLDADSTDSVYPSPYAVEIVAAGSLDLGSRGQSSGDVLISGPINSYGGKISIVSPSKITVRSTNANANVTLIDSRLWQNGAGTTTAGDLDLTFTTRGLDIPLLFWFPTAAVNLEIGSDSSAKTTSVFAGNINITGEASIDENFTGNEIGSKLTAPLVFAGMNLLPIPASVKSGSSGSAVALANANLQAAGNIVLKLNSKLSLSNKASAGFGYDQAGKALFGKRPDFYLAAAVSTGATNTTLDVKNSSLSATGGNITIVTSSANSLSSEGQLNIWTDLENGVTNEDTKTIGSAVAVGQTNSSVKLDATSELRASGSVSITNTATPSIKNKASLDYPARSAQAALGP